MTGSPSAELRFLGATETVTGSRFLVQTPSHRVLVDCGLFQGYKLLRDRNRLPFPVDPSSIDAVLLTHAHLDHSGYLPALVKQGFRGRIHSTAATAELAELVLRDSGHLLEEEAEFARRHGYSKHERPSPLYTVEDAVRSLVHFSPVAFDTDVPLGTDLHAMFVPAGHILGAAQVRLSVGGRIVHFTGDLGRPHDPLMHPPRPLERADVLVSESTYGDRRHSTADPGERLGAVVSRVAARGGVVVVPAFAVGRTESILLQLARLRRRGAIPEIPVFVNSPMANDTAAIYRRHRAEHRLTDDEFESMYDLATEVRTVDDSKLLNLRGGPMVVISASGMLTGGRVLHHVVAYGPDPRNAIVLTGFQAGGTRGAALAAGATSLRIFGKDVPIRAEVVQIDEFSAHADADELVAWMSATTAPPAMTYLVHGEPSASDLLRARIEHQLGRRVRVPENLETISLDRPA